MNFDEEKPRVDVDWGLWTKEKRTHTAILIFASIILILFIGENLVCNLLPRTIANLTEWNTQLAAKNKLEDKNKEIQFKKQLEKAAQQFQTLQSVTDSKIQELTFTIAEKDKRINELCPTNDSWKHAWMLKEAEAQYAFCKILEDYSEVTKGKYELGNCGDYCGTYGIHVKFENNSLPLKREAIRLFEKEYPAAPNIPN